jgi:hypothetical protein
MRGRGRSNTLALRLHDLFRGVTFGELRARRQSFRLLVTATDLTTCAPLDDQARRLREELHAMRGRPGSPFAVDAKLHVINVSLRSLSDATLREKLLRVPTAFQILPMQVRELQAAGRMALRDCPDSSASNAAWERARGRKSPHPSATERRPFADDFEGHPA